MKEPITPSQFRKPVNEKPDPMKVVALILAAFLILAGLNLTPCYRAAQERNRLSVQPTHTGENSR